MSGSGGIIVSGSSITTSGGFFGNGSGLTDITVGAGSIDSSKLAAGAVDTGKLAADSVTSPKLASDPASLGKVSGGSLSILSTHLISGATAHATANLDIGCGTGPSIVGNDVAGMITLGSTPSSPCVLTFNNSWAPTAPICLTMSGGGSTTPTESMTNLSIVHALIAGDKIRYFCMGR